MDSAAQLISRAVRVAVPLKTRCSRKWAIPLPGCGDSKALPVPSQIWSESTPGARGRSPDHTQPVGQNIETDLWSGGERERGIGAGTGFHCAEPEEESSGGDGRNGCANASSKSYPFLEIFYAVAVGLAEHPVIHQIKDNHPDIAAVSQAPMPQNRQGQRTVLLQRVGPDAFQQTIAGNMGPVIGSGPIIIGQACEFDYSGTQACKALREEGYRVVLVNSNPATIMTDPEFSDVTYIEPLTGGSRKSSPAKNPMPCCPRSGARPA